MNSGCLVIAEAGVNHNGSMDLAFTLIDKACAAGADFVKFQTFSADKLVTLSAQTAEYQRRNTGSSESQYQMLKRLELPQEGFRELARYCTTKGIGFLSTPFDVESAYFLAGLGMPAMKVSSGDLTNFPFLRELARIGLPVILSTGMATLGDIESAVDLLERYGLAAHDITLLHCTTEYPAPLAEVNLKALNTLHSAFPLSPIGYSDHTEGIFISLAAAAMGAKVIEKHFTIDRSMDGPDHKASLEPMELSALVSGVRGIDLAMGDGRKRPSPSELKNMHVARKSIVAACYIRKGEVFSEDNLDVRRPGTGRSPMQWENLIGQQASRDYDTSELI